MKGRVKPKKRRGRSISSNRDAGRFSRRVKKEDV